MSSWAAAAADPEVRRSLWEVFLVALGAVISVVTVLGMAFRLVKPHVDSYIAKVVGPIAAQVSEVHAEVKPDHGESVKDTASRVDMKLDRLAQQVGRLNTTVTKVEGRGRMVEGMLQQHLAESRDMVRDLTAGGYVGQTDRTPEWDDDDRSD